MEAHTIQIPKKKVTWEADTNRLSGRKRTRGEREVADILITMRYNAKERLAAEAMLHLGK